MTIGMTFGLGSGGSERKYSLRLFAPNTSPPFWLLLNAVVIIGLLARKSFVAANDGHNNYVWKVLMSEQRSNISQSCSINLLTSTLKVLLLAFID